MRRIMKDRLEQLLFALRSGEYKQSQGRLQTGPNEYCVLGVAARVAELNGVEVNEDPRGYLQGDDLCLQPEVQEYFGFKHDTGAYGDLDSLVDDNDYYKHSFTSLADIIESMPENLFDWGKTDENHNHN